jgi:hypothetical protein
MAWFISASQNNQKNKTFDTFFLAPLKEALKWVGQNGPLHILNLTSAGHPLPSTTATEDPCCAIS